MRRYKTEHKIIEGDANQFAEKLDEVTEDGFIIWGNLTATKVDTDEGILYSLLISKSIEIKD